MGHFYNSIKIAISKTLRRLDTTWNFDLSITRVSTHQHEHWEHCLCTQNLLKRINLELLSTSFSCGAKSYSAWMDWQWWEAGHSLDAFPTCTRCGLGAAIMQCSFVQTARLHMPVKWTVLHRRVGCRRAATKTKPMIHNPTLNTGSQMKKMMTSLSDESCWCAEG